jgi:hypothetical protein
MRRAAVLLPTLVLAGCGHGHSAYRKANDALLARIPVYPGAATPQTTAGGAGDTEFGARDWTLPAGAGRTRVDNWYIARLHAAGWRITDTNESGVHAVRGTASIDVGVRGRTLEVIVDSRGAPR